MSPTPTVVPVQPRVFKNYRLAVGNDDFAAHVSAVSLDPETSLQKWTGAAGNSHTDQSTPSWSVKLSYAQDWESDKSLSQYLLENMGQTKTIDFSPINRDGGPTFTVDVIIASGSIGGAVDAYGTSEATLGVNGSPEFKKASAAKPTT